MPRARGRISSPIMHRLHERGVGTKIKAELVKKKRETCRTGNNSVDASHSKQSLFLLLH